MGIPPAVEYGILGWSQACTQPIGQDNPTPAVDVGTPGNENPAAAAIKATAEEDEEELDPAPPPAPLN